MDAKRVFLSPHFLTSLPLKQIFQRLPGVWLLCLIPFAFLGPVHVPLVYAAYFVALHVLFLLNNLRTAYGVSYAYKMAKLSSVTDWARLFTEQTGTSHGGDLRHDMPYDHILHTIIIPNYKENMDTLVETLDVLASHSRALSQYKICLAMEASEQGSERKARNLMTMYKDSFYDIVFTMHPAGEPGEIRGKSSNVAWAAKCVAAQSRSLSFEILTVIDADTCFAEDYFNAVAYHYCVASPEQRRIMMFVPATVFDRNASDVPVFVRVTDMFWSIGVISNLYDSSLVKLPCSAYSVSMDLAASVNFWDAGPEAIGEDLHMFLKCFFATNGQLIVKSIFSPASQCNIEGEGVGLKGWVSGMSARYNQAKRHLWGSLDTGYALRKTLLNALAPGAQEMVALKHVYVSKNGKDEEPRLSYVRLAALFQRLLEAHVVMGHLFVLAIIASLVIPSEHVLRCDTAEFLWPLLSNHTVDPSVEYALYLCSWIRFLCLFPNIYMIFMYEKYQRWVGVERWVLQPGDHSYRKRFESYVSYENRQLPVQRLGIRSQLMNVRNSRNTLDWLCIPIAGLLFYVLPQFHAQLTHLYTERLDYKVAAKPVVRTNSPSLPPAQVEEQEEILTVFVDVPLKYSASTNSSRSDEGFFEESDDSQSLGSSGHTSIPLTL